MTLDSGDVKWQVPPSRPCRGSLGEAKEHPAISWSYQGSSTWSIHTLPRMDESPPIFLLDPSSVCWRPLQAMLPSAGSRSKTLLVRSYPPGDVHAVGPAGLGPVQPGCREDSRQEQDLQPGPAAGLGHGKTNKKRHQTARAPSSSAIVSNRRKDTKFCASLCRLLGSHKFVTLMICITSIATISLAMETNYCCWLRWGTFFEVRLGGTVPRAMARRGGMEGMGVQPLQPLRVAASPPSSSMPLHAPVQGLAVFQLQITSLIQ